MNNLVRKDNFLASMWMLLAALTIAVNASLTKILTIKIASITIFFLKSLLMLIFLTPAYLLRKNKILVVDKKLYILKSLLITIGFNIWYKSLKYINITEAISVTYLTPILNIIAGVIFFKEKMDRRKIIVIITSFLGVFLILRPSFHGHNIWLYLVIIVAVFWSMIDIISKIQVEKESLGNLIFYNSLLTMIFSSPGIFFESWTVLENRDYLILITAVLVNMLNIYSFYKAYQLGDLVVIVPIDFTKVLFSIILSYYMFGKKLEIYDLFGTILLLVSSLILLKGGQNNRA